MIQRNTEVRTGQPGQDHRENSGRELVQGVLEALPLGMGLFALTPAGPAFRAGNREFNRIVRPELPPRDGAPLEEVFSRADGGAIRQLFDQVRQRGEPQSYFAAAGLSPERLWNIDAYPVFTRGKVSHVMVLAEQTEEKLEARQRQQQETNRLRERADQLAELEKAKSEFLRLASHELRGPAAMLGGYLSMMEEEALGPIPERLRPVLPLLRAKAAQINMLANEMVEAARLEDRRLQLKRKRVDLRELARRSFNAALGEVGVGDKHRLSFEDHVGAPVMVQGDVMRLDIIIVNLIDNAIKYSPDGGVIGVHLSVVGDTAQLCIRDPGIGIAPQDMERLFIRFNRIAPKPDVPGTGLGLYLARELARLHGGDIQAVSRLGEGSEFTLSLPLDRERT